MHLQRHKELQDGATAAIAPPSPEFAALHGKMEEEQHVYIRWVEEQVASSQADRYKYMHPAVEAYIMVTFPVCRMLASQIRCYP